MSYRALEKVFSNLNERSIERIGIFSIFGGEPLSNRRLFAKIIALAEENLTVERFELVTNGTLLDNDVLDRYREHPVYVTVSIDGPEAIHDRLRGSGTHRKAMSALKKLREAAPQRVSVAATYTRYHEESGISRADLRQYLNSLEVPFEISAAKVPDKLSRLRPKSGISIKELQDSLDQALESLANGRRVSIPYYLRSILDGIVKSDSRSLSAVI
ncbi:hypothetical protein CCHOA_09685 [Corynebacterium choanae]|uniref:Radical SAM core domain-containing protein n=2 Tax=Corynebacterium choanae TaxID=1862358 RepID=A0A3G6JCC2_9CORY|nr:hypothetical protein CCHOA_09685 [Corynebacterium choanae]